MSLSMDPLSVVVAVNRSASIHEPLPKGVSFCLNILDADQTEIATACSSSKDRERRFEIARFEDREGVPYLVDAQACLFCDQDGNYTYGTHGLYIGRLVAAKTNGAVDPLLYVDGQYASLQIAQ